MRFHETKKVVGVSHTYERSGCGAMNTARFGANYFQLLKHKGKVACVILNSRNQRRFHTLQVLSPSEARRLIGWLARYIAYSDPDPISLAIAESKAHAKGIVRNQEQIAKGLGLE